MILFCDTSALIKLLITEAGSEQMHQATRQVDAVAVCRITWAEAMAGIAQRQRQEPDDADDLERARHQLRKSWQDCTVVEVTQAVVEKAGCFADGFALRGYDSVQLAAAHDLQEGSEQPLIFACFDRRLKQAAQLLQMEVLA